MSAEFAADQAEVAIGQLDALAGIDHMNTHDALEFYLRVASYCDTMAGALRDEVKAMGPPL